jgi:hypothetical protein
MGWRCAEVRNIRKDCYGSMNKRQFSVLGSQFAVKRAFGLGAGCWATLDYRGNYDSVVTQAIQLKRSWGGLFL